MNKHDNTLSIRRGQGEGHLKKKTAFTLTEVLITLVVIGIIAAITVPMIHENYKKKETVSKLKKAYANLSNAIKLSELDNGPLKDWEYPVSSGAGDLSERDTGAFFDKYLKSYIKINEVKDVTSNSAIKNIDGIDTSIWLTNWINLSDGTAMSIFSNPTEDESGYMWIFVDLNASAEPNRLGRDIFVFNIYKKNKLEFWMRYKPNQDHTTSPVYACKKGTGAKLAGAYCGILIFDNGFEMPKDYPW